jgi:predicted GIY-YIG superfamily endonuclease
MKRKKRNYWTKEKCLKEALRYSKRSDFKRGSGGAYRACQQNGWIDDVCYDMKCAGNRFKRLVYVYEFEDKNVYVGLTYNLHERDNKHKRDKKSMVFRHIQKTGLIPKLSCTEYVHVEEAKILEGEFVKKFKNSEYKILNASKTGGVGGGYLKWTFEKCMEEAKKFNSRKEFVKGNNSAYNSSRKNGWLDKVCSHMKENNRKPVGYWNKEKCKEEALRCKNTSELSTGAYHAILRNDWLKELCKHMKLQKPNGYWTKQRCLEEALKYNSRTSFQHAIGGAYRISLDKGWLNDICSHMNKLKK